MKLDLPEGIQPREETAQSKAEQRLKAETGEGEGRCPSGELAAPSNPLSDLGSVGLGPTVLDRASTGWNCRPLGRLEEPREQRKRGRVAASELRRLESGAGFAVGSDLISPSGWVCFGCEFPASGSAGEHDGEQREMEGGRSRWVSPEVTIGGGGCDVVGCSGFGKNRGREGRLCEGIVWVFERRFGGYILSRGIELERERELGSEREKEKNGEALLVQIGEEEDGWRSDLV